MAKDTAKTVKLSKGSGTRVSAQPVDEDEEESAEDAAPASTEAATATPELAETVSVETPTDVSASLNAANQDEKAFVTFVVHKAQQPAPIVGKFRFSDHGITELTEGMRLRIPFYVAIHLTDKNVGSIIS